MTETSLLLVTSLATNMILGAAKIKGSIKKI